MAKRIIRVSEYDLMYDGAVDNLLCSEKYGHAVLRQFHFVNTGSKHMLDVVVHGFRGDRCARSATEIYIPGSHKNTHFFQLLSQYLQYMTSCRTKFFKSTGTWLGGLRLRDINDVLVDLRKDRPDRMWVREMKALLTPEEISGLPKKFVGACLPVGEPNISFIHPGVVRGTTLTQSNTVRWKFLYRCRSFAGQTEVIDETDMLSIFPNPKIARCYENAQNENKVSPWPYLIATKTPENKSLQDMIQKALDAIGFVTLPLSPDFVNQHINSVETYMYQLMKCPREKSLFPENSEEKHHYYRYSKCYTTKHIPDTTGRTMYGHYSAEMKDLCLQIEPLILDVFRCLYPKDDRIWVTTSEIIIQRAFEKDWECETSLIKKS